MKYTTIKAQIDFLTKRKFGSHANLCKVLGIDAGNLSAIYSGNKTLGASRGQETLNKLGLQAHVLYSKIDDARRTKTL